MHVVPCEGPFMASFLCLRRDGQQEILWQQTVKGVSPRLRDDLTYCSHIRQMRRSYCDRRFNHSLFAHSGLIRSGIPI